MQQIELTKGMFALVDDEDFDFLNQWNWYVCNGYAMRQVVCGGTKRTLLMHRVVMGLKEDEEVDHINRNRLDNRKENLRHCTRSQNFANRPCFKNNMSGFKGVKRHRNKWSAIIGRGGNYLYLGTFETPQEAAVAYNEKAIEFWGDFAYLNNVEEEKINAVV